MNNGNGLNDISGGNVNEEKISRSGTSENVRDSGGNSENESRNSQKISNSSGEKSPEVKPEVQRQPISEEKQYEIVEKYVQEAVKEGLIAYNALEIKKKWPKAYEKCKSFMEIASHGAVLDDETIMGVFLYSARTVLFSFFDNEKIFLNIHGSDQYWKWTYEANESSEPFKSRVEAEIAGFKACFALLETKLK